MTTSVSAMDAGAEDVRLAVYTAFAKSGSAPSIEQLTTSTGRDPSDVRLALAALAAARHLVVDENGSIVMAHPFSAVPLGFAVMGSRTLWWGGCAWDSFALPHLLRDEPEVLVSTRCPACRRSLAWNVGREQPPEGAEVAHFLVPAAHMWDDVVRTCSNQRLFCSDVCVDAWVAASGAEHGYVMDLSTLWRLASHWYDGRLDRDYVRREPALALDYLRSVGLTGPFWGS